MTAGAHMIVILLYKSLFTTTNPIPQGPSRFYRNHMQHRATFLLLYYSLKFCWEFRAFRYDCCSSIKLFWGLFLRQYSLLRIY